MIKHTDSTVVLPEMDTFRDILLWKRQKFCRVRSIFTENYKLKQFLPSEQVWKKMKFSMSIYHILKYWMIYETNKKVFD